MRRNKMKKAKGFYTDKKGRIRPITGKSGRQPNTPTIKKRKLEWKQPRRYDFNLEYSDGKHEKVTAIADDPQEAFDKAMEKRKRQEDIPIGIKGHNSAEAMLIEFAIQKGKAEMEKAQAKKLAREELKYRRKAENAVISRKIDQWMRSTGSLFRPTERERPELYQITEAEIDREMKRRGYDVKLAGKRAEIKQMTGMERKAFGTMLSEVKRDISTGKQKISSGARKISSKVSGEEMQYDPELGTIPPWSNAYRKEGKTSRRLIED